MRLALLFVFGCTLEPPLAPIAEPGVDGDPHAPIDPASGVISACTVGRPMDPMTVATTHGLVRGTEEGRALRFAGIPFAAPPTGERRFRPTEPPDCWDGVRDASELGAICPQLDPTGGHFGDEDCLTLNVWAPASALVTQPGLPVLFWIHGGANVLGSSAMETLGVPFYDGRWLAESQNVVVVSANYRLGALGFLVAPALSGNYAIYDLIAALKWTKENIASFGGDPDRVMVFGESAGAFNTCVLLGSPLAEGLFSAALMESGACSQPDAAYAAQTSAPVIEAVGCAGAADVPACLRAADTEAFVGAFSIDLLLAAARPYELDPAHPNPLPFSANVDGHVLPVSTLDAMKAGTHPRVPFVIGSNQHEFELFLPFTEVLTCNTYEENVRIMFPAHADRVLALYPCRSYLTPRIAYADVQTDVFFTCPARAAARAASQQSSVYRYYFTHGRVLGPLVAFRAAHAMEIPFVFGSVGKNGDLATPSELELSASMQSHWASFAASGDPDPNGVDDWEPYDPARDNATVLDSDIGRIEQIKKMQCDFWDSVLRY